MLRVSRLAGREGMIATSLLQQSRCLSAVQAMRAYMSVRGMLRQANVSRLAGRGGSCLIGVQPQSRYLSAVHAERAESSLLWLQSSR